MKNCFKTLYLDIHMIQMLPPSNVNRGQMGEPKTALIGGSTRARISSPSQKRPARMEMSHNFEIAKRTKHTAGEIKKRLVASGIEVSRADELSQLALKESQIASSKADSKDTLVYLSDAQFDSMSKVMIDYEQNPASEDEKVKNLKKSLKEAINNNPTVDQLLFGRMFASDPSMNYDAATQVMNGFSVNEVKYEFDYFSAVDDLAKKYTPEKSGASHVSSRIFTDPVLYRYANVNLSETSELVKYDKQHAAENAIAFAKAFITTLPTGASNTYASGTIPSHVLLILREDRPVNFAPAFIETVKSENFITEAIEKLEAERLRVDKFLGEPLYAESDKDSSMKEMLAHIKDEIARRL